MKATVRIVLLLAVIVPAFAGTSAQTPQAFTCPATLPNSRELHGLPGYIGEGKVYEENGLWLGLPAHGMFEFNALIHSAPDNPKFTGWIDFKLHVFRSDDARGTVTVTGKRLDAPSRVRPVNDPTLDEFYGDAGFVPVALMIPGEGCWEFTATSGDAEATWVMEVLVIEELPATPAGWSRHLHA